jgi:hypothetical protein
MAKKDSEKKTDPKAKPAKSQIPARLLAAVRTVLEDADDTGGENSVVVGASAYNKLRSVIYDLTGQWWGIEVEELIDEDFDDEEGSDEDDDDEDEDDE